MKFKKCEIVYSIQNNKVCRGVVQEDFKEDNIGLSLFKNKKDAKDFLKIMRKTLKEESKK